MEDLQFYPTPLLLAVKAASLFNRKIGRLLEPFAGEGDLIEGITTERYFNKNTVECIEIDPNRQAILRDKGYKVVDTDFFKFQSGAIYTHILMNPPFNRGVEATIRAWNMIFNGEIVSILNAETFLNNTSTKCQQLRNLVDAYGSYEILEHEFESQETQRKTSVKVALIYLNIEHDVSVDFTKMTEDHQQENDVIIDDVTENQIALKQSRIKTDVQHFEMCVKSMKAYRLAEYEYNYRKRILGVFAGIDTASSQGRLQEQVNEDYDELKFGAWQNILSATEFKSSLSSKVFKELESHMTEICKMEFTISNIYTFLLSLLQNRGEMNTQMCLEIFDKITGYYTENRAYYRGWKSNEKHKEDCYKLKTTRFIIRANGYNNYSMDYEVVQWLADFDKAFALLDGKQKPEYSLEECFRDKYKELVAGERLETSYFDVRYYFGTQTIHFFPKSKELMDRLNRIVGRERDWLPPEDQKISEHFWLQYDDAEKMATKVHKEIDSTTTPYKVRCGEESVFDAHANILTEYGYDMTAFILLGK